MNNLNILLKLYIYINIIYVTIWLYTERTYNFPNPNFPKKYVNFGIFTKTSSTCATINSICSS